jgi:nitrogen fixation protein FixH
MRRGLFSFSNYRWVPWTIAGAFVVVAMVDGTLAFFALQSDPGLVSEHPFELGNGYNRVLDAGAAQDALGWRGSVRFVGTAGLSGRIIAELRDPDGAPLGGLAVKVTVVRPVEPLPQQDFALEAGDHGVYSAPVTLARAGQWEVRVTAERGADAYRFVQRIVVR